MVAPAAAFSSVVDAIQAVAVAALDPVRVVRGRDFSSDPGDVVMVGVQDATPPQFESAGTFTQSMQSFGGAREEVGTVHGLIAARVGSADQGAATDAACGYLITLGAAIRANQSLGLTPTFDYCVAELTAGDVLESQSTMGATTVLPFSVDYKIRL